MKREFHRDFIKQTNLESLRLSHRYKPEARALRYTDRDHMQTGQGLRGAYRDKLGSIYFILPEKDGHKDAASLQR